MLQQGNRSRQQDGFHPQHHIVACAGFHAPHSQQQATEGRPRHKSQQNAPQVEDVGGFPTSKGGPEIGGDPSQVGDRFMRKAEHPGHIDHPSQKGQQSRARPDPARKGVDHFILLL